MNDLISLYSSFQEGDFWYSFWFGGKSDTGDKEDQELCVYFRDDKGNYIKDLHTYGDLRREGYRDSAIFTLGMMSGAKPIDLEDLDGIIRAFLLDVDFFYKENGR